ncbi:Protein-glutamine gamma-glutamyltransferase 4, partial [Saguinus oedipus]
VGSPPPVRTASIPFIQYEISIYCVPCHDLPAQPWTGTLLSLTGLNPSIARHTLVELDPRTPSDHHDWQASLHDESGKEVTVAVTSTPNAIVGHYQLHVKTGSHILKSEENILYLLFNPWCKGTTNLRSAGEWQVPLAKPVLTSSCDYTGTFIQMALEATSAIASTGFSPEGCAITSVDVWFASEDTVFMPDEEERKEYILNNTGGHYVGVARSIKYRPWNFGQFEKNVLDCCISLLSETSLKPTDRRDPVLVCRAMCAMVGGNQPREERQLAKGCTVVVEPALLTQPPECRRALQCSLLMPSQPPPQALQNAKMSVEKGKGVLLGNWSGDYQGGTAPYRWTGSAPILQQYYNTKQAVCFGQCWVFTGVLTTVLRALGIPARSVTAFNSAHDTEKNLTVDTYVNEKGEKLTNMSYDSVWNFHVWTDAWMKQPDLPKGYNGWQVVDGTPQERSQGVFCCGPSPLAAIRKGDIFIVYDTRFVFSEVNGDRLIWLVKTVNGPEELHLISMETASIGKNISTKAVGQDKRRDITYEYKYPEVLAMQMGSFCHSGGWDIWPLEEHLKEAPLVSLSGSPEERQVMDHAFLLLSSEREHRRPIKENFLHMSAQSEDVLLGNPVNFTVLLERKTAALQNVSISGSFELQLYTGKRVGKLCTLKKTSQIQGQVSEVTLTLDSKTYINSLAIFDDEPVIRGFFIAEIVESKEIMASEVFLSFQYPEFSIEVSFLQAIKGSSCLEVGHGVGWDP